jgi:hypothetical protein
VCLRASGEDVGLDATVIYGSESVCIKWGEGVDIEECDCVFGNMCDVAMMFGI